MWFMNNSGYLMCSYQEMNLLFKFFPLEEIKNAYCVRFYVVVKNEIERLYTVSFH